MGTSQPVVRSFGNDRCRDGCFAPHVTGGYRQGLRVLHQCRPPKDWLKNISSIRSQTKEVEAHVHASLPLKLGATSRRELSTSCCRLLRRVQARDSRGQIPYSTLPGIRLPGGGPSIYGAHNCIRAGKHTHDAFATPTECMGAWRTYLQRYSMLRDRSDD